MGIGMRGIFSGGIDQNERVALRARFATIAASKEPISIWDYQTPIDMCAGATCSRMAIPIHISNKLHQKGFRVRSGLFLQVDRELEISTGRVVCLQTNGIAIIDMPFGDFDLPC